MLVQARTLTQVETGLQIGSAAASTAQLGLERHAQSPAVVPEHGDTADAINLADDSDSEPVAKRAKIAPGASSKKVSIYVKGIDIVLGCWLNAPVISHMNRSAFAQTGRLVCTFRPNSGCIS